MQPFLKTMPETSPYFAPHESMQANLGGDTAAAVTAIARRYIGNNPPCSPVWRAYRKSGITRGADYRYHADFNAIFPEAKIGELVYAWGKMWCPCERRLLFDVNCNSPMVVWCNGERVWRSTIHEERTPGERVHLVFWLKAGWNHVVIRFRKTACAFGGVFGTFLGKLPYYFSMPEPERAGQEGWMYTTPGAAELPVIPCNGDTPASTGVQWGPSPAWDTARRSAGQMSRLFGKTKNTAAVGWTRALFPGEDKSNVYTLKGRARSRLSITIGGKQVLEKNTAGAFAGKCKIPFGVQDIFVRTECDGGDWGFDLAVLHGDAALDFMHPANIAGADERWAYLGPLSPDAPVDFEKIKKPARVADGIGGEKIHWRIDLPDTWMRPYTEAELYGRWNYPLGVTLYGLHQAGKHTGSPDIAAYAANHMRTCCDFFDYALWDRRQYGGPTNVLNLLTAIDSLDDCGSACSALLEIAAHKKIDGFTKIVDYVADHINNRQARLPDGTFFRSNQMHVFDDNTMWVDDLYMSVPFLCRYYKLTGEEKYIDDAARQFFGFRQRLYMPELRLMSHVYDFNRGQATLIPWGRGNGWVLFSLAELLKALPERHFAREGLLSFFGELSAGILARQDGTGLWRQVLNEPDAYLETSCTAMFTYAYASGVRNGWYENPKPYLDAALRGWRGLTKTSVDRTGNVHGVCIGSGFSFQSEYYKKDLPWRTNDTHGIGIVLLAGVEIMRLADFLKTTTGAPETAEPGKMKRMKKTARHAR
jgi:rhamnogalacturonyl hydrolase YesR